LTVDVKVEGIEELKWRFRDPKLIQEPLKELLTDAANVARAEAETAIDGGTGIAVRSITLSVRSTDAKVYSMIGPARATSIEEGRSPGEDPMRILAQLIRWKNEVGYPEAAIVLAQQVKMTGTKGKKFIERAREKARQAMPGLVADMARKVEARWKQR